MHERAVERACAAQRTADAELLATTLDELVARYDREKLAAKRATRRALRRLA